MVGDHGHCSSIIIFTFLGLVLSLTQTSLGTLIQLGCCTNLKCEEKLKICRASVLGSRSLSGRSDTVAQCQQWHSSGTLAQWHSGTVVAQNQAIMFLAGNRQQCAVCGRHPAAAQPPAQGNLFPSVGWAGLGWAGLMKSEMKRE